MPTKKTFASAGPKKEAERKGAGAAASTTSARSTVSGPSRKDRRPATDDLIAKVDGAEALAAGMPFNANKPSEYGKASPRPPRGTTIPAPDPRATGSTLSESQPSAKVGNGKPNLGHNPGNLPLDRVRVDSAERTLTTNLGVPVADNQHSLKAGLRGPALLEDFILREKITHFDHERIPERIVHARGSAAHGYFECYKSMANVTRASLFAEAGKRTPVFVRFSTVIGERGSTDTPRDVRGFAVKFYTDEGNWDLVGNNIPVFFGSSTNKASLRSSSSTGAPWQERIPWTGMNP
jgi:catalase